jgi:hypothetical protein
MRSEISTKKKDEARAPPVQGSGSDSGSLSDVSKKSESEKSFGVSGRGASARRSRKRASKRLREDARLAQDGEDAVSQSEGSTGSDIDLEPRGGRRSLQSGRKKTRGHTDVRDRSPEEGIFGASAWCNMFNERFA